MTTKPSLIDRLLHRATAEQQTQARTFDELVSQTLTDETAVDEGSASAVLAACGKSASDLEQAVDLLRQRRAWAAAAAGAKGCQRRLAEITSRFEQIADEVIEQRNRLGAEERELETKRHALLAEVAASDQARSELHRTAPTSGKLKNRKLNSEKGVLIGQRRALLQKLGLPEHSHEDGMSSDLRSLQRARLSLLQQQKAESSRTNRLHRDEVPLADKLAKTEFKIASEERIAASAWGKITVLDTQIESLDNEGHELSEAELTVA
jgi:hypothetical protein